MSLNAARFPSGKCNTLLGKGRDLCLSEFLVSLLKGKRSELLPPALGCHQEHPTEANHGSHLVADEERGVGDSRNVVTGAVQARERCAG